MKTNKEYPRVFISYAREDYECAKHLYDVLLSQGAYPWLDKENLLPGQRWEIEIQQAIENCDFFIALLSTNSVEKRGFVQKELRRGLDVVETLPESTIFIIPARLDDCQPSHLKLTEFQWVDLFPTWDSGISRILKVLDFQKEALPIPKPAQTVPTLEGTQWSVIGYKGRMMTFDFRSGGLLHYSYSTGEEYDNGTWKQDLTSVYVEMNREFSQYRGELEGNTIAGNAQNVNGKEWKWTATLNEL